MALPIDFPLTSTLVVLDGFRPDDITPAYLGWLNDPEVVRFSNQRFRRHDSATAQAYLHSFDGTDNLFLAIRMTTDRTMIGTMTAYVDQRHGTADLGLLIGERAVWGRGFGLAAWQLLADALLVCPGMRKITAGTLGCNIGMLRIMQRSGMVPEGLRRQQEIVDGEPQDMHLYGRLREAA